MWNKRYFCWSCCNAEDKDTEGYTWISHPIKKAWGCTPRLPACIGITSKPDTITASEIQTFSFHGAVIIAQIKMSHEAMALLHHIYSAAFKRLFTLRKTMSQWWRTLLQSDSYRWMWSNSMHRVWIITFLHHNPSSSSPCVSWAPVWGERREND